MAVSPGFQYGSVVVGLGDGVVLPANPLRSALLLSNPGPNPIWLSFGAPAAANQGILLPPNAPPLQLTARDFPGLFGVDLHAITTGAAGVLAGLSCLTQVAT